jgi:hypothetical protein
MRREDERHLPASFHPTDAELDALARILRELGGIRDRRRRIDVAALAVKIAIIEEDDPKWGPLRAAAGIEDHPSEGRGQT